MHDGLEAMSALIDRMLDAGVIVVDIQGGGAAKSDNGAPKKTVCITGKLPSGKKKSDYAAPLDAAGYRLVDSVDASLDFLVLADPDSTSSKAEKARKLKVALISEEDLERML
jgi:NAD-dependent DNA ligase